jgi:hypothetical protein
LTSAKRLLLLVTIIKSQVCSEVDVFLELKIAAFSYSRHDSSETRNLDLRFAELTPS